MGKKKTEVSYTGPDYGTKVHLIGPGRCDPKNWTADQIRANCERWPSISKFFDFAASPSSNTNSTESVPDPPDVGQSDDD